MVAIAATASTIQTPTVHRKDEAIDIIDSLIRDLHDAERAVMFVPPFDPVPQPLLDRLRTAQERLEAHGVTF